MNQKQREKLLKTIVEAVQMSLKPGISDISEGLDINSDQMKEIKTQLDRVEHKIDLLLSSQFRSSHWPISKKKVFKS